MSRIQSALISQREATARKVLAFSAWTMVAVVVFSMAFLRLFSAESAASAPDGSLAQLLTGLKLVVFGVDGIVLWVSGVWHALVDPRRRGAGRIPLVVFLVIGTFASTLAYYFFYLLWRAKPVREASQQAGTAVSQ